MNWGGIITDHTPFARCDVCGNQHDPHCPPPAEDE